MTRIKKTVPPIIILLFLAGSIGYLLGSFRTVTTQEALAADVSPQATTNTQSAQSTGLVAKRPDAWYPRTEKLAPDEMFVVALGTGMPTPITKGQKSSAWYVELGNGDIFLFDCGTGSVENLFALRPNFARVDKVFASHLHTDHVGDVDALWVGGWLSGRYTPLNIYGPSGSKPELGTAAFVEGLKKTYAWDVSGRAGILPDAGGQLVAHEFDFKQDGGMVYEENGVRITSFPAIHVLDGPVSYRLEWNDLSYVFGGDSYPNKWFINHSKGADFVIHECMYTPEGLANVLGWEMRQATFVSAYIHTPPAAFGKIMSEVKPRLAVGYHTIRHRELDQLMFEEIRTTYDGPLAIADDLMCWTISKDAIIQREVVSAERVQAPPPTQGYKEAKRSGEARYSKFTDDGKWNGYTPPPLPER